MYFVLCFGISEATCCSYDVNGRMETKEEGQKEGQEGGKSSKKSKEDSSNQKTDPSVAEKHSSLRQLESSSLEDWWETR